MDQEKGREIFVMFVTSYFWSDSNIIVKELRKELKKYDITMEYYHGSVKKFLFWYDYHIYTIRKGDTEVFKFTKWYKQSFRRATPALSEKNSRTDILVEGDWLEEMERAYLTIHNCDQPNQHLDKERGKRISTAINKLQEELEPYAYGVDEEHKKIAAAYKEKLEESGFVFKVDVKTSGNPRELELVDYNLVYNYTVDRNVYLYKNDVLVFWGELSTYNYHQKSYRNRYYREGKWLDEFDVIMSSSPYYQLENKNDDKPAEMKLKPDNQ